MLAPSGDQAGGPRQGGGTRAAVTTCGDGSVTASEGGSQVARSSGVRWFTLEGGSEPDSLAA